MCIRDRLCPLVGSGYLLYHLLLTFLFLLEFGVSSYYLLLTFLFLLGFGVSSYYLLLTFLGILPVSYTHLDVYKRQVIIEYGRPTSIMYRSITISIIFLVVALVIGYSFVYLLKWSKMITINLYRCLPPLRGKGPQISRNTFSNFSVDDMGIMTPSFLSLSHFAF